MSSAIRLRNLTKVYRIYPSALGRALAPFRRNDQSRKFVALKNVSLDFPEGEVIAILGKNGSGKSTLLKLITGVTRPTSGEIEIDGRISAMLELTSGFDQQLSGLENIYLRAMALGISREEADSRRDEIIRFADIGEHINQPVRTYSSGMKARLGFAVSVSVEPDILIVDEVLAVGDAVFRLKCIDKMEEFRRQGKTILFVSHSLFTVKAFCTKALWLNEGTLMEYGELGSVIIAYEEFLKQERARALERRLQEDPESEALAVQKEDILHAANFRMFNAAGERTSTFEFGEDIWFEFDYDVRRPIEKLTFCYTLTDSAGVEVFMSDKRDPANLLNTEIGQHHLRVRLKDLGLLGGNYQLSGELWNNNAGFFINHSRSRPIVIRQNEYLGTGVLYVECDFQNV